MKLITLLFILVPACLAIDTFLFPDSTDCTGRWAGCLNLGPDNCCYQGDGDVWVGLSTRFSALPRDWNIETRSFFFEKCFGHANCDRLIMFGKQSGAICIHGKKYMSLQYGFINLDKATGQEGAEEKECVKVHVMGLADGTTYDLARMNETERRVMLSLDSAAQKKDVAESFKQYEMQYDPGKTDLNVTVN